MAIHSLNLPRSHPAKGNFEPFAAGPFSLQLAAFGETRWMHCVIGNRLACELDVLELLVAICDLYLSISFD